MPAVYETNNLVLNILNTVSKSFNLDLDTVIKSSIPEWTTLFNNKKTEKTFLEPDHFNKDLIRNLERSNPKITMKSLKTIKNSKNKTKNKTKTKKFSSEFSMILAQKNNLTEDSFELEDIQSKSGKITISDVTRKIKKNKKNVEVYYAHRPNLKELVDKVNQEKIKNSILRGGLDKDFVNFHDKVYRWRKFPKPYFRYRKLKSFLESVSKEKYNKFLDDLLDVYPKKFENRITETESNFLTEYLKLNKISETHSQDLNDFLESLDLGSSGEVYRHKYSKVVKMYTENDLKKVVKVLEDSKNVKLELDTKAWIRKENYLNFLKKSELASKFAEKLGLTFYDFTRAYGSTRDFDFDSTGKRLATVILAKTKQ